MRFKSAKTLSTKKSGPIQLIVFGFLGILLCTLNLTGCSQWSTQWPKSSNKELDPFQSLSTDEASTKLNYAFVHKNVLAPYCIRCHGEAGGVHLDDIDSIRTHSSEIMKAIKPPEREMPPSQSEMTDADRRILYFWVKAGAPLGNEPTPTPVPTPKPTPVPEASFDYINNGIFALHGCLNCHAPGTGTGTDHPLDKVGILGPNGSVKPGDPDGSDLTNVLLGLPGSDSLNPLKPMPLKGKGYSDVSKSDIELIKLWIKNGAKD